MAEVLVVGSVALDTIETPFGKRGDILGGSATMFALSAAHLAPVRLVGIVGKDFPEEHLRLFREHRIDTAGLQIAEGKTFRWHGRYNTTMESRETVSVQINVLGNFRPSLPDNWRETPYALLGNGIPDTQEAVLRQLRNPRFVLMDTMNLWIENNRREVEALLPRVHALCINEEEAKMLARVDDFAQAAAAIRGMGVKMLIIKQAEKGATLFTEGNAFHVPPYATSRAVDPTGAGDAFAGGIMGHIARKDNVSIETIREAIAYGNVMGSINVEGFGAEALLKASREEIERRRAQIEQQSARA